MQISVLQPFLEALVYKMKAAEKSEATYLNVFFPNLWYDIHLVHVYFKSFANTTSVDTLLDCLMERCERNAEVQVIRLAQWMIALIYIVR